MRSQLRGRQSHQEEDKVNTVDQQLAWLQREEELLLKTQGADQEQAAPRKHEAEDLKRQRRLLADLILHQVAVPHRLTQRLPLTTTQLRTLLEQAQATEHLLVQVQAMERLAVLVDIPLGGMLVESTLWASNLMGKRLRLMRRSSDI